MEKPFIRNFVLIATKKKKKVCKYGFNEWIEARLVEVSNPLRNISETMNVDDLVITMDYGKIKNTIKHEPFINKKGMKEFIPETIFHNFTQIMVSCKVEADIMGIREITIIPKNFQFKNLKDA